MTDLCEQYSVTEEQGTKGKGFRGGDLVMEGEPWVWSLEWKHTKSFCAFCFKQYASLRACQGCQTYCYCDENCQRADWRKEHKLECRLMKSIRTSVQISQPSLESLTPGSRELYTVMSGVLGIQKHLDSVYCAEVFLVLKIMNKIKRAVADKISGTSGTKPAKTILDMFPRTPYGGNQETGRKDVIPPGWPQASFFQGIVDEACPDLPDNQPEISESEIAEILDRVRYNLLSITDYNEGQTRNIAAGLFPCMPKGETVSVCSDHNMAAMFQGKVLRIYAIDEIPDYVGLRDVRLCDFTTCALTWTSKQRREAFENANGRVCSCRKCTPQYDAESNLLKCTTQGCHGCIPSDERALLPCEQCGATNENNLSKFTRLAHQSETLLRTSAMAFNSPVNQLVKPKPDKSRKCQRIPGIIARVMVKQWNNADVLQPEAHLRFAVGWNVAEDYHEENQYEEAWRASGEIIVCIRAIYPKYRLHRAEFLRDVALCPLNWWHFLAHFDHTMDRKERSRKEFLVANAVQQGMGCLKESLEIYSTLYGKGSQAVLDITKMLKTGRNIASKMSGNSRNN